MLLSESKEKKSVCASYFCSICYCGTLQLQVKQPEYLLSQFVCSHYGDFLWLESLEKVRQLITQLLFYAVGRQSFITRYSQPLPGPRWDSEATELHA